MNPLRVSRGFFRALALLLPALFLFLPALAEQAKKGTAKAVSQTHSSAAKTAKVPAATANKTGSTAKTTVQSSKTAQTAKTGKAAVNSKIARPTKETKAAQDKSTAKAGSAAAKKNAKAADSTRQKQAAETERGKVREQLSNLKKEIGKTETAKGKAENTLAQSEKAIKNTNRTILELEKKQTSTEARLDRLTAEQSRLETTIKEQQERLASLLQDQYISGGENRMKVLLSGDNPNSIVRDLQYMTYLSEAQAELTLSLRANLNAVDSKRMQTASAKEELEKISREKQSQKQKLEKEKAGHAELLAQLSSRLDAQKKEAERLQQDEKRLSALVDTLARKIAEQRKKAAAARKAAAAKQAEKTGKKPQKVEAVADAESSKSAFAQQKGRMKLPVKGTITAHYGSKRSDGPSWKGIFIQSALGSDIRAVANGEVVFADWLRGFGNLIIVDHGANYMTIYANAQSLKRKAGDSVKGGDVIASVGNSSDNTQTGLYFEMRKNGRAFDPMGWVTTR